jgi:hypothetical protein
MLTYTSTSGESLRLLTKGHPSARHSQVDYTKPDLELFPHFTQANAYEVILQSGGVLHFDHPLVPLHCVVEA